MTCATDERDDSPVASPVVAPREYGLAKRPSPPDSLDLQADDTVPCGAVKATNRKPPPSPSSNSFCPPPSPPVRMGMKRFSSDYSPEAVPKLRRTGSIRAFPSVSDLAAFEGTVDSAPSTSEKGGMRRCKSLPELTEAEPPWQRFQTWQQANPGASRAECQQFVERVVQHHVSGASRPRK